MNGKAKGTHKKPHGDKRLTNEILFAMEESLEAIVASQLVIQKHVATLTRKMSTIMASLQEVKDELESLKADTAAEHAQFAQVQQALADKIAELQAIIDAGPGGATSAELGDLLTGLQEVHAQVSAIVPDEPTA